MDNNNSNFDNKENLGHGIKGDINSDANLKSDKNKPERRSTTDKNNMND